MAGHKSELSGQPPRRQPRRFEPPPWELEAFERLHAQRKAPTGAAAGDTSPDERPPTRPLVPARASGDTLDEADVLEMLARLSEQEPDPRGPATVVTIASTAVLLPIGVAVLVWGVVAFVKAGHAVANVGVARTGALTMILFGAGFVAAAFWLVYRLLKQRGVLGG